MTPRIIAFIFAFIFAFVIVVFPGAIFKVIDVIDYRLKQFIAWIYNLLNHP